VSNHWVLGLPRSNSKKLIVWPLLATILVLISIGLGVGRSGASVVGKIAGSSPAGSDWLSEINMYRAAAGLSAVVDNPAWDAGLLNHLNYMEKTPPSLFTGGYASMHTENPASPFYTTSGALEAASSNLIEGAATGTNVQSIDTWFECPFHAVGMLRPSLGQVAFESLNGDAGLDVVRGLTNAAWGGGPVMFPGPGSTTNMTSYCGFESPSPLETCGWQSLSSVGLPLVTLLNSTPSAQLSANLTGPNGSMNVANGQLCIVDINDYVTTDLVYGGNGALILQDDKAVFLIPRAPLVSGNYQATISQPGQNNIAWSFDVNPTYPPSAPLSVDWTETGDTASINWTPPANSGSTPVTGYSVTEVGAANNLTTGVTANVCPGSDASVALNCNVTGLDPSIQYFFIVAAINDYGTGPFSSTGSLQQLPLVITDEIRQGVAGTPIALSATGGSGSNSYQYSVTGTGCKIQGDQVVASGADVCTVTATNPANGYFYSDVSSPPVTFEFSLATQRALHIVGSRSEAKAGISIVLFATGGSGNAKVRFVPKGRGCTIRGRRLVALRRTSCLVVAHKAASGIFSAASSPPKRFRFK